MTEKKRYLIDLALKITPDLENIHKTLNNFLEMYLGVPDFPEEDKEEIREKFNKDKIRYILIPIYDKHFTTKDLETIIAFYNSETGKKIKSEKLEEKINKAFTSLINSIEINITKNEYHQTSSPPLPPYN